MLQRFATLKDDFVQAGTTNSFVRQVCISVEQGLKGALSVATFPYTISKNIYIKFGFLWLALVPFPDTE